jgi:hypothetical protein
MYKLYIFVYRKAWEQGKYFIVDLHKAVPLKSTFWNLASLVSSSKSMRLIILWFCLGTNTRLKNSHNNVYSRIHPDESAQVCTTLGRCRGKVYLTGAKFPLPDACGAGDPSFRYPTRLALPPRIHVPTTAPRDH